MDGLPTLEFGDAIHLASAIHYQVDEFVTFDSRDSKKPSKAKRAILPLSGNVAGHRLFIAKPVAKTPELELVGGQNPRETKHTEPSGAEPTPAPPG
jgi:hypothetical protein